MSHWFSNLKLWQRLAIYFLPILVLPMAVLTYVGVTQWAGDLEDTLQTLEADHVTDLSIQLEQFLDIPQTDLGVLVSSANVNALAEAIANDNAEEISRLLPLVQNDFLALSNNSVTDVASSASGGELAPAPVYDQIRLLDAEGLEIVRIDREFDAEQPAFVVDNLQPKGDRGYFLDAADNRPGEIAVSPLNLNREGADSAIEQLEDGSVVPVIRYSQPLYSDNELIGVIVLTVYAQAMLDIIVPSADDDETFLINQDGFFLYNTAQVETTFGFEAGIEEIFGQADINILDESGLFNTQEAQQILNFNPIAGDVPEISTNSGLIVHYTRVAPDAAPDDYHWILASARDSEIFLADVQAVTLAGLVAVGVVIVFGVFAVLFVARQITRPISDLTRQATQMASGNLEVSIEERKLNRADEIGTLNRSFSTMAAQLKDLFTSMEDRVQARTNDLQASVEIAGAANQVRDINDLLSLTVNLIRDRFNFYYTQVYMIDRDGTHAILREGTGYVGRRLLSRGHQLSLEDTSLVAQAIKTAQAVVVQDTMTDPNFLPNELLPETRSEIAVPLRSQNGIVGVLDIQHNQPNAFEPETIQLFQAMADQLAVTFDNVSLFQNTAQRAIELETVAKVSAEAATNLDLSKLLKDVSDLVRDRFNLYHAHIYLVDPRENELVLRGGAGEAGFVMVSEHRTIPMEAEQSIVARAAREHEAVIVNDVTRDPDFLPHPMLPNTKAEMAVPLIIGDEVVGVLDVQADVTNRFTDEDVRVKSTLAGQIAVAVQNARSFELTQRRAKELATVAQVSTEAATNLNIEELLFNVSDLTKQQFDLYHAHIYLLNAAGDTLILQGGAGEAGRVMVAEHRSIPLDAEQSLVATAARQHQAVIVNDVTLDENFLPHPMLPNTRAEMAVPMIVGDNVLGVLDVQADMPNRFTEEDVRIQTTLASQLAVAVQNANAFTRTEQALHAVQELQMAIDESAIVAITDVTGKITYVNDMFCDVSKYSREELIGQDHRIINSGYHSKAFIRDLWVTIANGEVWKGEIRNQAKDGSIYWVDTTIVPQFNEKGKPRQYVAIRYDITERKIAEDAMAHAQVRTEMLASLSSALVQATDEESILDSVASLIIQYKVELSVLSYFEDIEADLVATSALNVVSMLSGDGQVIPLETLPTSRLTRDNYPFLELLVENGSSLFVLDDVQNDPRLEDSIKAYAEQVGLATSILVPLVAGTRWYGAISFSWSTVREIPPDLLDILEAIQPNMTSVVASRRAFQDSQRRANELAIVSQVSAEATTTLDVSALLDNVVELAKERFDLYHAHIYLVGDNEIQLELRAGAGEPGRIMVEQGRTIAIETPNSLVALAARSREGVISNNVTDDPDFLPNPLLPDTLSEMAIPMIVGEEVIGVLDVQSDRVNRFTDEDVMVKTTLASQIAVAVNNARSFALTQRRASEIETVADVGARIATNLDLQELLWTVSDLTKENFGRYHAQVYLLDNDDKMLKLAAGSGNIGRQLVDLGHLIPLNRETSLVAQAARRGESVAVKDVHGEPGFLPNPLLPETKSELAVPIKLGDDVIGVLDVQDNRVNAFSMDEIRTKAVLANQIAVAIQNARSFEQTRRRLRDVQIANTIAENSRRTGDLETVLESALLILLEAFDATTAIYSVYDAEARMWRGFVGVGDEMSTSIARTIQDPRDAYPHALRVLQSGDVEVVNDTSTYPGFPENYVEEIGIRSALVMPVFQGDEVGGVIFLNHATQFHKFDESEITLARGLANQISVTIDAKQAEENLMQRERYFRALIENSNDVITIIDGEGIIFYESPSIQMQFGYKPDDLLGDLLFDYIHADDVKRVRHAIQDVIQDGGISNIIEYRLRNIQNGWHTVEMIANNLLDDPVVNGLVLNTRDVTEEKMAEAIIRQQSTIVSSSVDFIGIANLEGTSEFLNQAGLNLTGYTQSEIIGQPITMFYPDDQIEWLQNEIIPQVMSEGLWRGEIDIKRKDGSTFPVDQTLFVVTDDEGQPISLATITTDITQRVENQKLIEEARQRAELLAKINSTLSQAEIEADIVQAFSDLAQIYEIETTVLSYFDNPDKHDLPQVMSIQAMVDADGEVLPTEVIPQTNIDRQDYPVLDVIYEQPFDPFISDNLLTDDRIKSVEVLSFVKESNIGAAIFIPLVTGTEWLGMVSMLWNQPTPLPSVLVELAQAIRPTVTSVVANRRTFLREQEARRESEQLAGELATVANVSAATTTILSVEDLLKSVSDLTLESFDLYHAHIYLIDNEKEALVLAAGSGEPGDRMKQTGHRIPLSQESSMVVRAAKEREGVISNDVTQDPDFLPNPLLPETLSEMAIPMMVGGEVIGVLDVQSNVKQRFTQDDVQIKTILASQVAVAVQNALSFAEIERQAERERITADRLREVDRLKSQFLANMSHELRTPLNSIIGYSEVLIDGVDGELTEDAQEDVQAIYDSGKHLLSIINEILDLAKIEAGEMRLDYRPVSLVKYAEEVVRNGQGLVKNRPVVLEMVQETAMPDIEADPVRLRQVLWNLVSNAIKFTEEGSVRIHLNLKDDGMALITVRDTGIGMDAESLALIFERFSQVDGSSTRRAGGTGLGLTITKQLIEMHGGEIGVESEEGIGTTFWFTMPVVKQGEAKTEKEEKV